MAQVQVGKLNIHYQTAGDGEPLVFIHGLGSSGDDWVNQTEFFSKDYQVIAYDGRGHGQSGKPPGPYSVSMFAADLAGLLKALDVSAAHVVGISMGGWVAFQFAVDHPEMIKSLTVINSGPELVPHSFKDYLNILQRLVLFQILSMRRIGEILAPRLFIKPEQGELRQTFIEAWALNHKPAYMASFRAGLWWSVVEKLDQITCPVLVIASDEDYTPVAEKQVYVDKMPTAELVVIEDARHAVSVERPEELNRVIKEFLD